MDEKLKHSIYLMMLRIREECCVDENEYYDNIMQGILLEIYHAGCKAQSEADREAVNKIIGTGWSRDRYSRGWENAITKALVALAATAIGAK